MGIDFKVTDPLPGTDRLEISVGRVRLRCFTRADLDRRAQWPLYEEVVFAHLNLHLPTARQRDAWFEREWTTRRPFWFAVEGEGGELIGTITLREVSRWRKSARLGIHLHPGRLGHGYGTEAMRLFLDYYFNNLCWKLLKLDVATFNERAIRCYEKVGFEQVGEFWRTNLSGIPWLQDERFADVRDHLRLSRGVEKIRHCEMHLDAKRFQAMESGES